MINVKTLMGADVPLHTAINNAIARANSAGDYLYFPEGVYDLGAVQLALSKENASNVKGIIGDGINKTVFKFSRNQTVDWNPGHNKVDPRPHCAILVDGLNGLQVRDFTVECSVEFYRKANTYFGSVCGLVVANASNTTVTRVAATGANRAGILFTVTDTRVTETQAGQYYRSEITSANMGLGKHNRAIECITYKNRVAGIMFAWQSGMIVESCTSYENGHRDDGGTGYGITAMSGSVNTNFHILKNYTHGNYRKGLDVHDGEVGYIVGNRSVGDRFFGIAIESRGYYCTLMVVTDNILVCNPSFRLTLDDDAAPGSSPNLKTDYYGWNGICIQNKSQLHPSTLEPLQTWGAHDSPVYEIKRNTISGIDYDSARNSVSSPFQFRNNENEARIVPRWIVEKNIVKDCPSVAHILEFRNGHRAINGGGQLTFQYNEIEVGKVSFTPFVIEDKVAGESLPEPVVYNQKISYLFRKNQIKISGNNLDAKLLDMNKAIAGYVEFSGNYLDMYANFNKPIVRWLPQGPAVTFAMRDNIIVSNTLSRVINGAPFVSHPNPESGIVGNLQVTNNIFMRNANEKLAEYQFPKLVQM